VKDRAIDIYVDKKGNNVFETTAYMLNVRSTTSEESRLLFDAVLLGSFITKLLGPRLTTMAGGLVSCLGLIIMSQCALLRLVYFGCSVTGRM